MNVKPNIGIVNALIRITCGFTILAWSTAKLVKRPWRESYVIAAMMGAMKVGEGIVRFCPITAMFERSQEMMQNQNNQNNNDGTKQVEDQMIPYNPT